MTKGPMPRRLPKHCVEDVDRYGKVRVYLRMRGRKKVLLKGTPWTPSFMEAYERAKVEDAPDHRGPQPGTWEWLCRKYFENGMASLGPRTARVRRAILTRTFAEPTKPGSPALFRDMPLSAIGPKAIEVLRDRLIQVPASANERIKAIRHVMDYAVKEQILAINAAKNIAYIQMRSDGFYTWSTDDVIKFTSRHPIGTKAYLAMALMLYLGARRSDVVTLGKQHVRSTTIRFTPMKTRHTTGKALTLPILPPLQRAIEAGPCGDLTFLITEWGKPYTANGFGNWFRRRCRDAGLPDCSAHGLRKLGAVLAAENGATDAELQAIFGWSSQKMPAKYRKGADQQHLAARAMHRVQLPIPVGHSGKKER